MTSLDMFSKEEATKILLQLGVPANLQGFRYLQNCVVNVVKNPKKIRKVTKNLYPEIGEEYNVNASVVERSMRHATEIGYMKTGFKSLHKMFGLEGQTLSYKPTNCELIAIISEVTRFKAHKAGLLDA
jgi:hypothetical protein